MDPAPRFKQARDRGCAFLLRHQGIRGEFPRSRPALDDYWMDEIVQIGGG